MAPDPLLEFLEQCSAQIVELADSAELNKGAMLFAESLASVSYLGTEQAVVAEGHPRVPVASSLAAMKRSHLVDAALLAQNQFPWVASHRMTDQGTEAALAPFNDILDFDSYRITAGLLVVGAGYEYPLHSHPPQELYLTISGTAQWMFGGAPDVVELGPGRLIYNHPNDLHRVVADKDPVLALYVLW